MCNTISPVENLALALENWINRYTLLKARLIQNANNSDAVRSDTPKHRKRPLNDQSTNDQEKYVLPHKRAHNHYPTRNILPAWCEALCGTSTPAKRSHITSLTSGNKRNNEDSQLDHGQITNGTKHTL